MPYKFCPNCFSTSYSAVEHKIWLCPGCGKDISFMPSEDEAYDLRNVGKTCDRPKPYRLEKTKL
jgi:ribosomal protein L37AE/L43A